MNKQKLIELRCKAWGITEDEYYCNQCSDFSLEDMARAYRRGKNKGARDKAIQNVRLQNSKKKMQNLEQDVTNYFCRLCNLPMQKKSLKSLSSGQIGKAIANARVLRAYNTRQSNS